jgi:hypothetical protein
MKKLILTCTALFVLFGSYAYAADKEKDAQKDEREPGSSIVQIVVGPMIDVKDWGANQFALGLTMGGKYIRFGLGYNHASTAFGSMNAFRPYLLIDVPFSFDIGKQSSLAIGPIIDFGPSFGFVAGQKLIDVMQLGFGLDVKFYFNDSLGVSIAPVHFTNSFATYTTGGPGFTKQYRMTYDLLFSFLLRW